MKNVNSNALNMRVLGTPPRTKQGRDNNRH